MCNCIQKWIHTCSSVSMMHRAGEEYVSSKWSVRRKYSSETEIENCLFLVTDAKISQLGLPRASTTDLVLTIRPYHGHTVGLNKLLTQPIFPSHSKHPT